MYIYMYTHAQPACCGGGSALVCIAQAICINMYTYVYIYVCIYICTLTRSQLAVKVVVL